ncbi:YcdB/YcdC domain-containing protein [Alicyclobacillus macrosporangiidus]|uniref:S-layer homology domain-containing protein n=1 Tax=Alicyclobacillus macrosporangiidus TaxID=392015 RepID=A0A1I7F2Y3_9BACL|nr:YcdB/YcdC domain-containing protein [Alicyclobacillus macrosporangiidus]SFU30449.1 S-layer homology domain-containing protein [Alicyclobacillus macrosporangiidus]
MEQEFRKERRLPHRPRRSGASIAASTVAVTLTMACGALPVYAATSQVSSGTAGTSGATSTSASAASQDVTQLQPKLSQQDALVVVEKLFSPLVANLGTPTVTLNPDPLVANQVVYEIDWNMMAFANQSGPRLNQNYAHATVDANTGQVLQFQNTGSAWQEKNPIRLADAQTIAVDWVKKLAPSQASSVALADKSQLQGGFSFLFVRKVNGILAPFDSMRVQLGTDGQLQYYNFSWHEATFPAAGEANVIPASQAQKIYESHLKLALRYQQRYTPQGPGPMELVYQPIGNAPGFAASPLPVIDATTGEEIGTDGKPVTPPSQGDDTPAPIDPNGPKKFPAPSSTPLTQDQVTAQVAKQFGLDGPDWTLRMAQQHRGNGSVFPNHVIWSLSYTNAKTGAGVSVDVDGTDGVIVRYNAYSQGLSQSPATPMSAAQLQAAANAAVAKLYPNLTGAIAPEQTQVVGYPPNQAPFFYDFLVNGIPVPGLQLTLDPATGQVQGVSLQIDPSTEFPSPSKALSLQRAMSEYEQAAPLVLQYMLPQQPSSPDKPFPLNYGSTAKLVYAAAPLANGIGTLNALTGEWEQPPFLGQSMGSGIPANLTPQAAISVLEQHGIITSDEVSGSGAVNPSETMTRGRFIAWLSRAYNMNIGSDPTPQFPDVTPSTPYASELSEAILQGWIHNQGPIQPQGALTRAQAAQWLVEWMGWQGPAAHPAFFKVGFSDAKSVPSWALGAAAMMSQAGVLPLQNGKFMPNQTLTVGEAAQALVRAVQVYLSSN